ncbi:MAG: hypothetical protein WBG71_15925 [Leeuwenhoekiella sp.]
MLINEGDIYFSRANQDNPMQRQNTLPIFKILLFLFILSLPVGCQQEDEDLRVGHESRSLAFERIAGEDLTSLGSLQRALSTAKKNLNSTTGSEDRSKKGHSPIFIDDAAATVVRNGDIESYTFYAQRPEYSSYFENVIFKGNEELGYETFLVSYAVSRDDYANLMQGRAIAEQARVKITRIDPDRIAPATQNKNNTGGEDACYKIELISIKAHAEGVHAGENYWLVDGMVMVFIEVNCPDVEAEDNGTGTGQDNTGSGTPAGSTTGPDSGGSTTGTGTGWTTTSAPTYTPGFPGVVTGGTGEDGDFPDDNGYSIPAAPSSSGTNLSQVLDLTEGQAEYLSGSANQDVLQALADFVGIGASSDRNQAAQKVLDRLFDRPNSEPFRSSGAKRAYTRFASDVLDAETRGAFGEMQDLNDALLANPDLEGQDLDFMVQMKADALEQLVYDALSKQFVTESGGLEKITRSETALAAFMHIKDMAKAYWPQDQQEWGVVLDMATPVLLELGVSFIPGGALLTDSEDALAGLQTGDYLAATLLVVDLTLDFVPWTKVAKIGKKMYDTFSTLFKIVKTLGSHLKAAGQAIQRGFEFAHDGVVKLFKKETDPTKISAKQVIAKGDKVTKFLEVTKIAKGSRPNPSTYLDAGFIKSHLDKFKGGVTKITASAPNRPVGPPGGTFVLPKSQADDLIQKAGGDPKKLEDLLGLDRGSLGNNPVRVDTKDATGLRMPSGNEPGANGNWIPGGQTSGGILEATVDQIPLDKITVKPAF